jgi:hypothetical protein
MIIIAQQLEPPYALFADLTSWLVGHIWLLLAQLGWPKCQSLVIVGG